MGVREIPCMTSRSSQVEIGPETKYQDRAASTYRPKICNRYSSLEP